MHNGCRKVLYIIGLLASHYTLPQVSPRDLGDDELATFATALDRDGDGLLSLNELLVLATGVRSEREEE
jgi:hypothetical protein